MHENCGQSWCMDYAVSEADPILRLNDRNATLNELTVFPIDV